MIKRRLTINAEEIAEDLASVLDNVLVYEPSTEKDFCNVVYACLCLLPSTAGYKISVDPDPVSYMGKTHKPDISIQDQIALELKVAKTRRAAVSAIKQAEIYRDGGYPAAFAVIYISTPYELEIEEEMKLKRKRIYPIIITGQAA